MTPGTACVGTMTKARSTGSARSRRLRTAGRPNTVWCRGCTGISGPEKPAAALPARMNRAQPEVSDAPTTARLRGAKNSRRRSGVTLTCWPLARSRAGPWLFGLWLLGLWLLGEAEGPFADDGALDLAGAGVDGAGAAAQE